MITGASSGIGLAAAVELARRGDEVVLVGRDPARLGSAADRVREVAGAPPATFRADFARLDDVRRLAGQLRDRYHRIDLLANNAGTIVAEPTVTVDGFELTMQTNHLAPFLLSQLLRDRTGRIVGTASGAHGLGALDPDDLNAELRGYRPFRAYATSKQANVLFAAEAARRWPEVFSAAYHPGPVRTRIVDANPITALGIRVLPFLPSPARGARTLVWLAHADRAALTNGGYYRRRRLRRPWPGTTDPELAGRLWEASRRLLDLG
ncbi:SDR family NAD(P)-dependent oxidoreductase [Solwaraspora sp. WMMD1047]|uniref:SDR family NAD(P)-dependent oxidoreductase n=1 Tax=Solwaraspora sp. WMMD1047 TaxID=3016102 RepID=UPI002416746B|nr:SDR family NAD(P)-dependent oxidoreductase [Solwaraspora sp. WMMD1047]MDG4833522.1 SDR family NAD(P)-dependent oxidoreductase [Solwaraspora sp. WMMD1047]